MAKHKQESMDDWYEYAKDIARAERELEIVPWVRITIGYREKNGHFIELYRYDYPKESHERYGWIVRWRTARLQCEYPRHIITNYYSPYDKATGLKTDAQSCLFKLAAAKAQITKARRSMESYIANQTQKYPMFYDSATDHDLIRYRAKIAEKEQKCITAEQNIRQVVKNHQNSHTG